MPHTTAQCGSLPGRLRYLAPLMPKRQQEKKPAARTVKTTPAELVKITAYLHQDEAAAVDEFARKHRCSRADVLRRVVRSFFQIED